MPFGMEKISETSDKISKSLDEMNESTKALQENTKVLAQATIEMTKVMKELAESTRILAEETKNFSKTTGDLVNGFNTSLKELSSAMESIAALTQLLHHPSKTVVDNMSDNMGKIISSFLQKKEGRE